MDVKRAKKGNKGKGGNSGADVGGEPSPGPSRTTTTTITTPTTNNPRKGRYAKQETIDIFDYIIENGWVTLIRNREMYCKLVDALVSC